ncbi:MAG: AI-2E family transporter [Candidatus Sericytochromatia bacterium]|nr:AI-2E family transporter [Candidatus Tanganyikabacteria bacterium]
MPSKRHFTVSVAPGTLLLVFALVVVGALVPRLADILALLILGLVVAAAMAPLTEGARTRLKLPGGLAPLAVFLLVFGAIGLIILSMAPLVALQANEFAAAFPGIIKRAQASWDFLSTFGRRLGIDIATDEIVAFVSQRASQALKGTASAAGAVLGGMATFGAVLIAAFFLLLDGKLLRAGFVRLFPPDRRPQVDALFEPITARLGAYVRGVLTNMAALGGMLAIGYSIIGLPFGLVIGVLTGLLEIIPVIGGAIGGVVAILVGFTISWKLGLLTVVVFFVAQMLQNNVISPIVMAKAVEMPPVVLLFALLMGSQLLGLTGAIIAVPVAAAVMVLIDQVWVPALERVAVAAPAASVPHGDDAPDGKDAQQLGDPGASG